MDLAILGAGSWGTALALLAARNGHRVYLLARNPDEVEAMRRDRENRHYLPGFEFPPTIVPGWLEEGVPVSDLAVIAVPSGAVGEIAPMIGDKAGAVALAAKGLEQGTGRLLTDVVAEANPGLHVGVLSGPNLAVEIAKGVPTIALSACTDNETAHEIRQAFHCLTFRVTPSDDVIGVELAGALKNVLAIGAGMSDGLGFGDNTKGAFLSRGLMEMAKLGTAMGGRMETFLGPAGVGDLFATAASRLSRNYRFGFALSEGKSRESALASVGQVVEGAATADALQVLCARHQVDAPIMTAVYQVIHGELTPHEAVTALMSRP